MTSQSPAIRFAKHKAGHKSKRGVKISNHFAEKYGLYLRPSLYEHLNPLTKQEAVDMERKLAEDLKRQRYAVWWN